MDTAVAAGKRGALTAALTKAELADALKDDGPPLSLRLAPTDEAFTAALVALGITAEELPAREALTDFLKFHVIPGAKAMCTDLKAGERRWATCEALS